MGWTEAVNELEQLPQPKFRMSVWRWAFLSIAIPAAATALASVGLAISGLKNLLSCRGRGTRRHWNPGNWTRSRTIGALALPVSAVFGGIAAWIATIKIEGITDDFQHLADVIKAAEPGMVAVFDDVVAEVKVLAGSIPEVSSAMSVLSQYFTGTNWIKEFIDAATPAFQLLDIAIKEASTQITNAAAAFLVMTGHTAEAVAMLERLNGQTSTYTDEEKDAKTVTDDYNESVTQTVGAHIQLVDAVTNTTASVTAAKAALDDAKKSYNDGTGSLQALEKAQLAYNQAVKDSGNIVPIAKNSIADIAGALATANDAVVNAQKSVDQLNKDLADGITQLGGFDIATELLPAAMDRLTKATQAYQTAIDGGKDSVTAFVNTVTGEIGKLGTLYDTWTKLKLCRRNYLLRRRLRPTTLSSKCKRRRRRWGITLTNTGGVDSGQCYGPDESVGDCHTGAHRQVSGIK